MSLPSYSTDGDLNTGIYFPAADTVGVAAAGKEMGRFYSASSFGVLKLGLSDTEGGKLLLSNNANAAWVSTVGSGIGMRLETPNNTGIRMKVNSVECFEFYDTLMFAYKPIKLVDNASATASGAQVVLNAYDVGGTSSRRSLALGTEEAVVTESVTSDRTLAVTINGTTYKICLKA